MAKERTIRLPGAAARATASWQPALLLRQQSATAADRRRPVLYIHGATFPSASSVLFRFDGVSWADTLNRAGYSVWALDFAGFGGSDRYPQMAADAPPAGEPLGRAAGAARQIERAVRAIIADTGIARVSIIAHSWGTIATGLFATEHPDLVDRLVLFAPIVRRQVLKDPPPLGPWRLVSVAEQHKRFVEDVPAGHPPVLLERDFPAWSAIYLQSDPSSGSRTPPSVKTPNGPAADIISAWAGLLPYDPAGIAAPVAIVRGAWDSLCTDADASWLLAALTAAPDKRDTRIASATHLMHLEVHRDELYRATTAFLDAR